MGDGKLRDLAVDCVSGAPEPKRASEIMIRPGVVRHCLGDAPALHPRYWLVADRAREHVVAGPDLEKFIENLECLARQRDNVDWIFLIFILAAGIVHAAFSKSISPPLRVRRF
jgi:hypothetical protein